MVKDSLVVEETAKSRRWRDDENWDPDWIQYTFTAWGQCLQPSCKQRFAISGTGGVGPEVGEEGEMQWDDYFSPAACHPMPSIIDLPNKCPDNVKQQLESAFALFWSHPEACAGRIRVALELLMDHVGVPRKKTDSKGKEYPFDLHARIDFYSSLNIEAGTQLMALKWFGNTGSHGGEVSKTDLLDAFEILEHTLVEIIDKRAEKVALLAKKLTQKHSKKKK
ncbi:DUF4145 domain-containing protein [Paraburkholderia sediminicola]|uniref:DUF4145 domain-containing protein n=1 Tax=Paraburkholderia sediminicola TaxID=458836 RepID=UPI0038B87922